MRSPEAGLRRLGAGLAVAAASLLPGACGREAGSGGPPSFDLRRALGGGAPGESAGGFTRAMEPPELRFPRDHGPHPAFRTEWWYWTGNVAGDDGAEFGFELVFFRVALQPPGAVSERAAALASDQLVLAHAALTDVGRDRFHFGERLLRLDGVRAGLSGRPGGGEGDGLHLFCGDWSARAVDGGDGFSPLRLQAGGDDFGFELDLVAQKPLVLQGDRGLSQKSGEPGNASIYYSATRLLATGAVTADGVRHEVRGLAWCDREWSTSALGPDLVGWDWFSLQLDDGTELMWYQLRTDAGAVDPHSQGTFVLADGTSRRLLTGDVAAEPRGTWRAADGRAEYPAEWRLAVPVLGLDLEVTPRVADQELRALVRYWEGSVAVRGTRDGRPVSGLGYLEMTGYAR